MSEIGRNRPPCIGEKLLRRLLPESERRALIGDYEELYKDLAERRGHFIASLWYWMQLCRTIPSVIHDTIGWGLVMIRNYLKIALRNMKKYKVYAFINMTGLAVGIACFLLMMLYVRYEYSFDRFHKNANSIYRIVHQSETAFQGSPYFAVTMAPLGPALVEEYPEVLNAARIRNIGTLLIQYMKHGFYESGIYADNGFFTLFTFPLVSGDPETVMSEPFTIALSENLSRKLFGEKNPIGEVVRTNGERDMKVTGVFKDIPENSHLRFQYTISLATYGALPGREGRLERWSGLAFATYIELRPHTPYFKFDDKLSTLIQKYCDVDYSSHSKRFLQPLKSIHHSTQFNFDFARTSDKKTLHLFTVIAFLILGIACMNYVNLKTARSAVRLKEVGIRKVVGAQKVQLIQQYLGESIFSTYAAFLLAVVLVWIALPHFSAFVGRPLSVDLLCNPFFMTVTLAGVGVVGSLSGAYPALVLSSMKPVCIVHGSSGSRSKRSVIRNGFVGIQFAISIVLMACTMIAARQLDFIRKKDVGFNRDQVVVIPVRDTGIRENVQAIRNAFSLHPNVLSVSAASNTPLTLGSGDNETFKNDEGEDVTMLVWESCIDYQFIDVFGMQIIMGRNFSEAHGEDIDKSIIVNETLVRRMGWENPLGKEIENTGFAHYDGRIIGVIKDFHVWSLHHEVDPMFFTLAPEEVNYISVKIRPHEIPKTLNFLEETYTAFRLIHSFDYYFLNDRYNSMYQSEIRFGTLFKVFSLIAIFIASLGLLGLSAFTVQNRKKEIGIRKALGASIPGIFIRLSLGFTKWVVVANIIAWPIAYYAMSRWLQNFAYRINVNLWILILSGLAALVIALLTVSVQTIKAATANPVEALYYE